MKYNKTPLIYEEKDPTQKGITYVAIRTNTTPPHVWAVYSIEDEESLSTLPNDILIIPVEQAKKLFDIKKGNIADLVE